MSPIFEARDLSVSYAHKGLTLQGVDLSVPSQSIVALLGANGAGKTTFLRAVSGLIGMHGGRVVAGEVLFEGQSLLDLAPHLLVGQGITQVPEGRMVFKHLSVEENLMVGASRLSGSLARQRLAEIYDLFPQLRERRTRSAGWLSGGEQQMLAIGRALVSHPKLLLIDELSLGLAPLVVQTIYQQLVTVADTLGTAMLIVEQNARIALQVADEAFVLRGGRVVLSGTAEAIAGNDEMRQSYLS